jgi:hypothetical protein
MRRDLLALLVLLVSSSVAFAQGGQFFGQPGTTPATTKVSADEVLARIMTFDQNTDGRVSIGELSERMRPLVERGDKNGDQALDRSEIAALSRAPSPQGGRGGFPGGGGYSFGDDSGLSSRQHIEGALEDLRLTSDKSERALPIVRAYADSIEGTATADLLRQMEPLLTPEQLTTFTTVLNSRRGRVVTQSQTGARQVFMMTVRDSNLLARVDAMQLGAEKTQQAHKLIEQFKTRVRIGSETERTALMSELKGFLNNEEIDNYRAALERRPVVASSPFFGKVAFNDVVQRSRDIIDVVRPAVLLERGSAAPIVIAR